MTPQHTPPPGVSIHPATDIGLVSLVVADLQRSLAFYTRAMGFAVLEQDGVTHTLGAAGTPLLVLVEERGARPVVTRATGLYHFAILMPSRLALGQWLRHWLSLGAPLPGQGDHLVSEALYLSDPDGHGIEVYRDRPRDGWRYAAGRIQMASDPVDIRGLLEEADAQGEPWQGLPAGTRLGHIHLQVGDIARASTFYHDVLGFDVMAEMPGALFVSAGGYHHHLGLNTWHSRGAGPAPAGTASLRCFTLRFADEAARAGVLERVRAAGLPSHEVASGTVLFDPWGTRLVLHVGDPDVRRVVAEQPDAPAPR